MTLAHSSAPRLNPALVARSAELSCLRAALADAIAARGRVVTLCGPSGTGKTRLLNELRATEPDALWLVAGADPGRPSEPYGMVAGLLLEMQAAGPAAAAASEAVSVLLPTAAELRDVAPEVKQRLLAAAVPRAIQQLARKTPLVLCLEDIHRADKLSLGILAGLATEVADHPILLLATFSAMGDAGQQPDAGLVDALTAMHGVPGALQLELTQLSEDDTRLVVGSCFDGSGFRSDFLRMIHRRSHGVPQQILHYLAFLRDQGVVRKRRDLWTNAPVSEAQIPEYGASIGARLAALSPDQLEVLSAAAVRGKSFEVRIVADAVGQQQAHVRDILEASVRETGLLRTSDEGYTFEHDLVWQAVYEGLTEDQRQASHYAMATALLDRHPEDHHQLAHHLLRAARIEAATPHLLAAAQVAIEACDFWDAQQLLDQALVDEAAPQDSRMRAEALLLMAEVAARLGESRRSEHICDELMRTIPSTQWPDLKARTLMHLGRARGRSGNRDEAVSLYGAARASAADSGDVKMCATIDLRLGNVAFERSQLPEAERLYLQARDGAVAAGSQIMTGGACTNLGVVASVRGDDEAALQFYTAATQAYELAGYRHGLAMTHHNVGMTCATLERWQEALAQYDKAEQLARHSGTVDVLADILISRAAACAGLGDLEAAELSCHTARGYYEQMQDELGLAECDKVKGTVYRRRGQLGEAETALLGGRQVFLDNENQLGVAECSVELGLLHTEAGNHSAATQFLTAAVTAFTEVGAERERSKAEVLLLNLSGSPGP